MAVPSFAVPLTHRRLPLVVLYAADRCNSHCITCNYWRHGGLDHPPAAVESIGRELA